MITGISHAIYRVLLTMGITIRIHSYVFVFLAVINHAPCSSL